jgi:lysophospholipase L1-like esterase
MRLIFLPILLAALLVACTAVEQTTARAPTPPVAETVSSPQWATDMAGFAAGDARDPPPAHPIVFTGSSSVRMWRTLAEDFPGRAVLNRGFGGSQLRDATWYADEVAIHYRPRQIVLYSGDNDIDAGRTPEQVRDDFRAFVARIRRDLPGVPIAWLAIKPSLARIDQLPAQQRANALVKAEAARMRDVAFIDVATPMLDADGRPRAELFLEDGLHMNREGYALWRGIVAPYLR